MSDLARRSGDVARCGSHRPDLNGCHPLKATLKRLPVLASMTTRSPMGFASVTVSKLKHASETPREAGEDRGDTDIGVRLDDFRLWHRVVPPPTDPVVHGDDDVGAIVCMDALYPRPIGLYLRPIGAARCEHERRGDSEYAPRSWSPRSSLIGRIDCCAAPASTVWLVPVEHGHATNFARYSLRAQERRSAKNNQHRAADRGGSACAARRRGCGEATRCTVRQATPSCSIRSVTSI